MTLDLTPISIIIIVSFLLPILKGLIFGFSSRDLKKDVENVEVDITFILSVIFGLNYGKLIFNKYQQEIFQFINDYLPQNLGEFVNKQPIIVYFIIIPLLIFIIYEALMLILRFINALIIHPLADGINNGLKNRSRFLQRLAGGIINIPKGICYAVIVTFILNIISMINVSDKLNEYLKTSKVYNSISNEAILPIVNSNFAKSLPKILNNSFKIEIVKDGELLPAPNFSTSSVVYFNGTTLEEGIKSDSEIDAFSKSLASEEPSITEKAKTFYSWISENIDYDNNKAEELSQDKYRIKSGAIEAYDTRKGVCFDYACLFVAFCRANNIKVRMVTGEGYSGINWVSHAWNQVYIPEKNAWINVDPTFGKAGNYFDNKGFFIDHRKAKVVGEW